MATIGLYLSYEGVGKNKFNFLDLNLTSERIFEVIPIQIIRPIEDKFAVVKMVDDILVLGCPSCNNGQGSIVLYDISKNNQEEEHQLEQQPVFEYNGKGYQVGNHVLCRRDYSLGQLRIEFSEYDLEHDEIVMKTIFVGKNKLAGDGTAPQDILTFELRDTLVLSLGENERVSLSSGEEHSPQFEGVAHPFNKKLLKTMVVGHRGGFIKGPENSLTSIQAAIDNKLEGIEIDVSTLC